MGLTAGLAAAIAPLVVISNLWATLLGQTVQDFGHVPLFAVIASLLLALVRHLAGERLTTRSQYVTAFITALGLAVATEWFQMLGPRNADLWDLARNAVGSAMALVVWATLDRRLDGTRFRGARSRHAWRLVALAGFIAFLVPLVNVAVAYRDRAARFPVLYDFEARSERLFITPRLAWYEFIPAPEGWVEAQGTRVAHITFSPLGDGALIFAEPHPDWEGHDALVFEFFHPGPETLEFGLRIDDQHRAVRYIDRFNRHVFVKPGFNRVRIAMEEIVAGPAERDLDVSSIVRVVIFPVDPAGGYEFYLGRILLESEGTLTSATSRD